MTTESTYPPGYRHYPRAFDQVRFEQLTAERVTIEYIKGEEVRRYKNSEHARNEELDCEVYGLGAFRLRSWNYDAILADLKQAAAEAQRLKEGKPPAKRPEPNPVAPSRGGMGRGWRL